MITIKNLNFNYHKGRPLFSNMDMHLEAGHIYGLLGKNGAGKSTLLKNIAGLVFPVSGSIEILGHKPQKREVSFLQEVSFIPEEFDLPSTSIAKFVKANAVFYPNFDHNYFNTLITEFEIPTKQRVSDMSYGQKKKFIISFGLATGCKLIIMDEPTNGLDIPSKAQFRKIMASALTEDKCFIISTHQVRDLDNLIDSIIVLDENKVALNTSVYKITDKIVFKKVVELNSDVLYAEQNLGGFNTIQPNKLGEDSKVDLELLFNGLLAKKQQITNLLND